MAVTMTGPDMLNWLKAMDISAAEGARRLGIHPNTMTRYKREGAPMAIALACSALFHRLGPWK
jgi:hypothetical protein